MTRAEEPDRRPALIVVAILWVSSGVIGLLTALLMHSVGIAVFALLCLLAGVGLALGHRVWDQRARQELVLRGGGPIDGDPIDGDPVNDEDLPLSAGTHERTTAYTLDNRDTGDIVDAEFSEYIDDVDDVRRDVAPADQDDGTGYDDHRR